LGGAALRASHSWQTEAPDGFGPGLFSYKTLAQAAFPNT
jgi:hypothetical protein